VIHIALRPLVFALLAQQKQHQHQEVEVEPVLALKAIPAAATYLKQLVHLFAMVEIACYSIARLPHIFAPTASVVIQVDDLPFF